jgi:hypothetical protein
LSDKLDFIFDAYDGAMSAPKQVTKADSCKTNNSAADVTLEGSKIRE